ncbi:preprotein translocase subunit YajC [Sodalis-like secondary symbiont of Drepanosiphum platanoidis]|uniref:preprotein translocase subunit YajC n=1 Tax=Sodalis-like secondary symbiont of Drepanosiphum platanoidis TaxID=2994493 RepID=UPI003464B43A
MNFFFSQAMASNNTLSQDNPYFLLIIFSIFIILFYIFSIIPHQKKNKIHIKLIKSLKIGDEVLINTGFVGKILSIGNDGYIAILLNDSTKIIIKNDLIINILPKGIMKKLFS